jgi:hypothetical protein
MYSRSRTLFWNIRHVHRTSPGWQSSFSMLSVFSTFSCYRCLWFTGLILEVSNNSICKNIRVIYLSIVQSHIRNTIASASNWLTAANVISPFSIVQTTASGLCDFIAQYVLVRVNHCTIPSFLAIAYLGQSIYLHLISRFQFIASSYLASAGWRNNICTSCSWKLRLPRSSELWAQPVVHHHTSAYHTRNNRIRYGIVCHPTDSLRVCQLAISSGA